MEKLSVFKTLNSIDVSEKIHTKNGLNYLSWASAIAIVKEIYPSTEIKVYEKEDGRLYWDDGKTAWVKVSVTIENLECIEYLPVMDFKNKAMPVESITSMEVNKAIQRATVKAIARHGLGLYIYEGSDLPDIVKKEKAEKDEEEAKHQKEKAELEVKINEELKPLRDQIVALSKAKIDSGTNRDEVYSIIESISGFRNPSKIKDKATCEKVIAALKETKGNT